MSWRWLALAGLVACGKDDADTEIPMDTVDDTAPSPDTDPPACTNLTWENFGDGFVHTWCTSCHGAAIEDDWRQCASTAINFDTLAEVRLWAGEIDRKVQGENILGPPPDDWDGVGAPPEGVCNGVPTAPDCTCVDEADQHMPPSGGLSAEDKALLHEWVSCGTPGEVSAPGVCDAITPTAGTVELTSQAAADAFCADGQNHVAGDLVLQGAGAVALDCLCGVDGTITVGAGVDSVELPNLVSAGALVLDGAGDVTRILAPELRDLTTGDLDVSSASSLSDLGIPWLRNVAGAAIFSDLPALDALPIDQLAEIGGDLVISDIAAADAGLLRIHTIGGDLLVIDNASLKSIDDMKAIESIGGSIRIERNNALTGIEIANILVTLGGDIDIHDNPDIDVVDGFTLLPVARAITITGNDLLEGIDGFDNVLTVDNVTLADNEELTWLVGFVNVQTVTGTLTIADNVDLGSLAGFEITTEIGSLQITGNGMNALAKFLLLTDVNGDMTLSGNGLMTLISGFTALQRVDGDLTIHDHLNLELITGLSALESIGGSLIVTDNRDLPTAAAEALRDSVEQIDGAVVISGNL